MGQLANCLTLNLRFSSYTFSSNYFFLISYTVSSVFRSSQSIYPPLLDKCCEHVVIHRYTDTTVNGGGDSGGYISLLCGDKVQFWKAAIKHTQKHFYPTKYLCFVHFMYFCTLWGESNYCNARLHEFVLFICTFPHVLTCVSRFVWDCKSVTELYINYFLLLLLLIKI
jgi:hypothetical protein